jgi:hypothetical protein
MRRKQITYAGYLVCGSAIWRFLAQFAGDEGVDTNADNNYDDGDQEGDEQFGDGIVRQIVGFLSVAGEEEIEVFGLA